MFPASPEWLAFLTERPFAHRGLHGPGIAENSLAAARAAIAAGFGIECDVRLARDGVPHVFHDARLGRMTDATGAFAALDRAAVARLRLRGSDEAPPTLAALLALTAATPLLIEVKSDGNQAALAQLCKAVAIDLSRHGGPAAVMGFDPLVCHWFRRHAPAVPRGMVLSRRYGSGILSRRTKTLALARARPHFLAYDLRDLPRAATPWPRSGGRALLVWTVRDAAQRNQAQEFGAQLIFEGAGRPEPADTGPCRAKG
jgi:glycerophosphoryl diester phosphodiesterase